MEQVGQNDQDDQDCKMTKVTNIYFPIKCSRFPAQSNSTNKNEHKSDSDSGKNNKQ